MVRGKKKAVHEREMKMWLVCLLVPKQEEDLFPSGISGIVELINCTWKLIDNTVLYFL